MPCSPQTVTFDCGLVLMLAGYFSLNVPSGLTLYWFTNNLLTTGQQVCNFACPGGFDAACSV